MKVQIIESIFSSKYLVMLTLVLHELVIEVFSTGALMDEKIGTFDSRSNVGEDTCSELSSKNAACIPPIRCRQIWGRNIPDMSNSSCGGEKEEKICCPLAEDEDNATSSETTTMKILSTVVPATLSQNESSGSSFRNRFRVFPENCGRSGAVLTRIVGGQDAALNSWPWMAIIYLIRGGRRSQECGGALITSSHILTAAHCIVTSRRGTTLRPRQLLIRLGELDLSSMNDGAHPIDVGVRTVYKHEEFNIRTFQNDIAILELEHAVDFNEGISPICLPFTAFYDEDLSDRNAIAAGWGSIRFNGPGSPRLQEVQLRIWKNPPCREIYRRDVPIIKSNLCAGDGDKDACTGDSGGPLMLPDSHLRYYVIGIVSFGKKCAEPGIPGVYARVTSFLDWIEEKIR